jgi:hypothetical protein
MPDDELMNDAVELLRWALRRSDDLGVFHAGYNIGREPGDVWHCHGCNAEFCRDHGHRDDYDVRRFPHAADCKYVAARTICGMH